MTNKKTLLHKVLTLALGIVILDQVVKLWVKFSMLPGEEIKILGDFFKIHFVENPGAAFGLTITDIVNSLASAFGSDFAITPETGKILLNLLSLAVLGIVAVALVRTAKENKPIAWILGLILGGAVGNLIDRLFYGVWFAAINDYEGGFFLGRVVDMFYIDIWKGFLPDWIPIIGGQFYSFWPIFNVADISISVAIILLLLFPNKFLAWEEKNKEQPSTDKEKTELSQEAVEVNP